MTTNTVPLPPEKQLPNIVGAVGGPAVRGGGSSDPSGGVGQQPLQRRGDVRLDRHSLAQSRRPKARVPGLLLGARSDAGRRRWFECGVLRLVAVDDRHSERDLSGVLNWSVTSASRPGMMSGLLTMIGGWSVSTTCRPFATDTVLGMVPVNGAPSLPSTLNGMPDTADKESRSAVTMEPERTPSPGPQLRIMRLRTCTTSLGVAGADVDVDAFGRRVRPVGLHVQAASGREEQQPDGNDQARATPQGPPATYRSGARCGLHDLLDSVSTPRWPTPAWLRDTCRQPIDTVAFRAGLVDDA